MNREILERYRRDEKGQLIIDISAAKVADLYDDFDKHAPYIKKELDYDLVEYLIDSARELGREPFSINFSFSETLSEDLTQRLCKSIRNYFSYLLQSSRREALSIVRTSCILVALGLAMLGIITYFRLSYNVEDSIFKGVLSEGLVIAAWVAVWEGIEAFLTKGPTLLKERKIYRNIISSEFSFFTH